MFQRGKYESILPEKVKEAMEKYRQDDLKSIPVIPDEKEILKLINTLRKLFNPIYEPLNEVEKTQVKQFRELATYLIQQSGDSFLPPTMSPELALKAVQTLSQPYLLSKEALLVSVIDIPSPNIIKWLIEEGVDVNIKKEGDSLLYTVCNKEIVSNLKALMTSENLNYTELRPADYFGNHPSIFNGVVSEHVTPKKIAIANLLEKPTREAQLKEFQKLLQDDLIKVDVIPVPADKKEVFSVKKMEFTPPFNNITQVTLTCPDRFDFYDTDENRQEYIQKCSLCLTLENGQTQAYRFKDMEHLFSIEAMLDDYRFKTTVAKVHEAPEEWKKRGITGVYDEGVHEFYNKMHKRMKGRFREWKSEEKVSDVVVVELGCGHGKALQSFLEVGAESFGKDHVHGYGFDYAPPNIKEATEEYSKELKERSEKNQTPLPPCEFKILDVTKEECETELKKIREKHPNAKLFVICSGLLTSVVLKNATECLTALQRMRRSNPDCIFATGLKESFYDRDMLQRVGFTDAQTSVDERFYCLDEIQPSAKHRGLQNANDSKLLDLSMCYDPVQVIMTANPKELKNIACLDLSYTDLSHYSKEELENAFKRIPELKTVLFISTQSADQDKLRQACGSSQELITVSDNNEFLSVYPVDYYPHLLNPAAFIEKEAKEQENFMQLVRYSGTRVNYSLASKPKEPAFRSTLFREESHDKMPGPSSDEVADKKKHNPFAS